MRKTAFPKNSEESNFQRISRQGENVGLGYGMQEQEYVEAAHGSEEVSVGRRRY